MLLLNLSRDVLDLIHIELAGEHRHVSVLGVELERFDIADIELGREVDLLPYLPTVLQHSHVAGNDCRDAGLMGREANLTHQGQILLIHDCVDCQIALNASLTALIGDMPEIIAGEVGCRMGPHIETLDAEVDGVGPSLEGRGQAFPRADRRHDFVVTDSPPVHFLSFAFLNTSIRRLSSSVPKLSNCPVISSVICISVRRSLLPTGVLKKALISLASSSVKCR